MIFKIKYDFVILELIGQAYFDLKRNNRKNVWNKCLINWRVYFQNVLNPLLVLLRKTGFFDRIYTRVYGETKFRLNKKCICVSYLGLNFTL